MSKRESHRGGRRDSREQDPGSRGPESGLERAERRHDLLVTLMRELFQTEKSASLHPLREAERLGDVPPAHAFRGVAEHATRILERLPDLARHHDLPVSQAGKRIGELFSVVRTAFADHLIDPERSYRGTILGMRHGIDLVTLMRATARASGDVDLATWFGVWLDERIPLVDACAEQLVWFASHPAEARSWSALHPRQILGIFGRRGPSDENRGRGELGRAR